MSWDSCCCAEGVLSTGPRGELRTQVKQVVSEVANEAVQMVDYVDVRD